MAEGVCIRCGYPLEGLPETHVCPECGMHFGATAPTWRGSHASFIYAGLLGFSGGGFGLLTSALRHSQMAPTERWVLVAAAIIYVAALVVALLWLPRIRRFVPMAVAAPDALYLRLGGTSLRRIPWSNVSRAELNQSGRGAHIYLRSSRMVENLGGILRTHEDAEAFVNVARRRIDGAEAGVAEGAAHGA